MTLCIAAISREDMAIVTASDLMISAGDDTMSMEDPLNVKVDVLPPHNRWGMLFAGDPDVRACVSRRTVPRLEAGHHSRAQVAEAVEASYREEVERRINAEFLSPFGLDREAFLQQREALGNEVFSRLWYRIDALDLDTTFLLAGFEPDGTPRLFTVSHPGVAVENTIGFEAIGVGAPRANGILYGTYSPDLNAVDLAYRLCEAKFFGESALGVGKRTIVTIFDLTKSWRWIRPSDTEELRSAWEQRGWPEIERSDRELLASRQRELAWRHARF